jgi:hypothetical protein
VLPTDPQEQNAKWFQLYRRVADRLTVQAAHRNYLFYRDYAVISILLIIAFGVSGFWFIPSLTTAAAYLGGLVAPVWACMPGCPEQWYCLRHVRFWCS